MMLTYGARYKGLDWIGSARFMPMLALVQLSYWRKLVDKVEAGVSMELSLAPPGGPSAMLGTPSGPEGQATVGMKYDFRGSVFRGQVDSNGKVACMLEKRLNPLVACTFVGSIDHFKNESKVGLSVSIESMTEETMEQQQRMMESGEEMITPPF